MLRRAHVLFLFCAALLAGALLACSFGLAELSASEQAAAERNLAIVVNQSNPVNELTMAELRRGFFWGSGHWPEGRRKTPVVVGARRPGGGAGGPGHLPLGRGGVYKYLLHGPFSRG